MFTKFLYFSWRDETPEDTAKYHVQMSLDGINFETVATVKGVFGKKNYSYKYRLGLVCDAVFFRLAYEGKYSKVSVVSAPCALAVRSEGDNLFIQSQKGGIIEIFDSQGRIFLKRKIPSGNTMVNNFNFPMGVYFSRIENSPTQTIKFVKR